VGSLWAFLSGLWGFLAELLRAWNAEQARQAGRDEQQAQDAQSRLDGIARARQARREVENDPNPLPKNDPFLRD
jgi:hypothetical protein